MGMIFYSGSRDGGHKPAPLPSYANGPIPCISTPSSCCSQLDLSIDLLVFVLYQILTNVSHFCLYLNTSPISYNVIFSEFVYSPVCYQVI